MSGEACRQIDAEFDRRFGRTELAEQARAHMAECPRCTKLYGWVAEKTTAPAGDTELSRRIVAQIAPSLTPVKPIASPAAFAGRVIGLILLLTGVLVAAMGGAGIGVMNRVEFVGISAVLAAGAILFSLTLGRQTTPGARRRIPTWTAMLLFSIAAAAGIVLLFPWHAEGAPLTLSWQCALRELTIAVPAATLFWVWLRKAVVLSPAGMGASVGAVAGLLGVAVLQFTCVYQEALHLLLWHWSVLAVTSGGGALVAWGTARVRRRDDMATGS